MDPLTRRTLYGLVVILWLHVPSDGNAQTPSPELQSLQTPRENFALPQREPREPDKRERILPAIAPQPQLVGVADGLSVRASSFRFEGNTAFTDEELAELLAPYSNRIMTARDLQSAREQVTRHYIENGYVTSGATIPDQEMKDGIITIRIIEGHLASVGAEGTRFFRGSYFERRLMLGSDEPLRIQDLEQRLQVIQQDWRIERVAARLVPGERRGEAVLKLQIDEATPVRSFAEWDNDTSSNLGEQTGRFAMVLANILGLGDQITARVRGTEGLLDYEFGYSIPITPWDTQLHGRYRMSSGEIVEGPLAGSGAEFTSTAWTAGVGLIQPLIRTRNTTLSVSLLGEWRSSQTKVDGRGFGFPNTGADANTGISKLAVARATVDWLYRTQTQVFAIRQLLSVGLPIGSATQNPTGVPDTNFVSSLTQLRMAVRLPQLADVELLMRADFQYSNNPLMPLEQISAGGLDTVRGYGVNELIRDRAVIASVELRAPLYRSAAGHQRLQLAPFLDIAYGWNDRRTGSNPRNARTLLSAGLGLRYQIARLLHAEIYWGAGRLVNESNATDVSVQHDVNFRVRVEIW